MFLLGAMSFCPWKEQRFLSVQQNKTRKIKKVKGAGRVRWSGRKEQVWLLLSEGLL